MNQDAIQPACGLTDGVFAGRGKLVTRLTQASAFRVWMGRSAPHGHDCCEDLLLHMSNCSGDDLDGRQGSYLPGKMFLAGKFWFNDFGRICKERARSPVFFRWRSKTSGNYASGRNCCATLASTKVHTVNAAFSAHAKRLPQTFAVHDSFDGPSPHGAPRCQLDNVNMSISPAFEGPMEPD